MRKLSLLFTSFLISMSHVFATSHEIGGDVFSKIGDNIAQFVGWIVNIDPNTISQGNVVFFGGALILGLAITLFLAIRMIYDTTKISAEYEGMLMFLAFLISVVILKITNLGTHILSWVELGAQTVALLIALYSVFMVYVFMRSKVGGTWGAHRKGIAERSKSGVKSRSMELASRDAKEARGGKGTGMSVHEGNLKIAAVGAQSTSNLRGILTSLNKVEGMLKNMAAVDKDAAIHGFASISSDLSSINLEKIKTNLQKVEQGLSLYTTTTVNGLNMATADEIAGFLSNPDDPPDAITTGATYTLLNNLASAVGRLGPLHATLTTSFTTLSTTISSIGSTRNNVRDIERAVGTLKSELMDSIGKHEKLIKERKDTINHLDWPASAAEISTLVAATLTAGHARAGAEDDINNWKTELREFISNFERKIEVN